MSEMTFFQTRSRLSAARVTATSKATLPERSPSSAQQPHTSSLHVQQGDTVLGLRLLAVNAPEIAFRLPGSREFTPLTDPAWQAFVEDPWDGFFPAFEDDVQPELIAHLRPRLGKDTAKNHARHALEARTRFEMLLEDDALVLGHDALFVAFAFDAMDRQGHLLAFVNRNQPDPTQPDPRPPSYNERLLRAGLVAPHFVWPNLEPFMRKPTRIQAVFEPGSARSVADRSRKLRNALAGVHEARLEGRGIFDPVDPLQLLPFELRFLAERRAPDHWVIDLDAESDVLLHPQRYFEIEKPENRLFIPPEFKPLFESVGWQAQES